MLERPLPVFLAPGLPTRACSLSHTPGLACPRAFAFAPSLWPEKFACSQTDPSLFRSCPGITSPDGLPSPKVTTHHYPIVIPYFHHTTSRYQKIHCWFGTRFPGTPLEHQLPESGTQDGLVHCHAHTCLGQCQAHSRWPGCTRARSGEEPAAYDGSSPRSLLSSL